MTDRAASEELATGAGLRYVSDEEPGHRRIRRGKGFSYVDAAGETLSEDEMEWARSLVIPPAWTDVWISPDRRGHILATGYDDAGRKQYIYHPDWEDARASLVSADGSTAIRRIPNRRADQSAALDGEAAARAPATSRVSSVSIWM